MPEISMKEMLEAGTHFGHQKKRWNPKMKPFIYTERAGVHIFDLQQTAVKLTEALEFIKGLASAGKTVLFVATKKQASAIVSEEAKRAGSPYVTERWVGGLLTNWKTVSSRIKRLKELAEKREAGEFEHLTKKEKAILSEEEKKIENILGGIKDIGKLPDALFVIDILQDDIAVREAKKLGIPVVAVVDSNADPDLVDYVIPGNDDAVKAISIFAKAAADAVIEGRGAFEKQAAKEKVLAEKAEAKNDSKEDEVVVDDEVIEEAETKALEEIKEDAERELAAAKEKGAEKEK